MVSGGGAGLYITKSSNNMMGLMGFVFAPANGLSIDGHNMVCFFSALCVQ